MACTLTLESKDPADVVDYGFDWSEVLASIGSDTIVSTAWRVSPDTMALGPATASGAVRAVFLSGGVVGEVYTLTCTVTTAGGRTIERSATIYVEQR